MHVVSSKCLSINQKCLLYSVLSGLRHTSKGLPEATIECKVLSRRHTGCREGAVGFLTTELPAIGKAQSPYGSCHATFLACFCIVLPLRSALAVVCLMDSTPNTCADTVRQERLQRRRERERQQRAEETTEDREQQLASVCCHS